MLTLNVLAGGLLRARISVPLPTGSSAAALSLQPARTHDAALVAAWKGSAGAPAGGRISRPAPARGL